MKTILKKLKKGFTIVELVIVIAVIAILAAVLIPTLANLVDSANESNDMVLVSNLNKIVAAYDTVGEIDTVNDALDGALENGYSVSNLTPTSEGNVIVYDSVSNRFALLTANALTTATPDDDDVIYKDTSTTKTDWTDYTTWVFVDASAASNGYVTITTSGETYTLSGTNSYILTGSDWNGRSVVANYGLVLFDSTKTITLNSVTVKESTQTGVKADTNSSAKTAISKKTIDNTSSTISIVVNVKAANLTCNLSNGTVDNYSEISVATSVKNCNFNEHGSALGYDWTQIGSGKFTNYNSDLNPDFIYIPTGKTIDEVYVDNTSKVPSSTLTYQNAYEVSIEITVDSETGNSTISLTVTPTQNADSTVISGSIESGAVTLQLGTEKYPYLLTGDENTDGKMALAKKNFTDKITDTSSTATVYFKLLNDVYVTSDVKFNNKSYCGIDLDLGSYTIYVVAGKTISFTNTNCYNKNFSIENGSIVGIDSNYTELETADSTSALQVRNSMDSVSILNCTFKQAGITIGDTSNKLYTNELVIDNCKFNYTNGQQSVALINTAWNGGETITISNSTFSVESDYTLYLSSIQEDNGKVSINLSNNTWKCYQLDNYAYAAGNTLPSYNAFNEEGECDKDKLQSSTTAFIAAAHWYIQYNSQYISLNDDGTNSYTVEGVTKRNSSTTLITNNVDAWGVIINKD